jgi:hypothetical protein
VRSTKRTVEVVLVGLAKAEERRAAAARREMVSEDVRGVPLHPLRLAFRDREGVVVRLGNIPLRLAFRASEGVVVRLGNIPLRLAFQASEGVVVRLGNIPLRLAFRAREGVVWWCG